MILSRVDESEIGAIEETYTLQLDLEAAFVCEIVSKPLFYDRQTALLLEKRHNRSPQRVEKPLELQSVNVSDTRALFVKIRRFSISASEPISVQWRAILSHAPSAYEGSLGNAGCYSATCVSNQGSGKSHIFKLAMSLSPPSIWAISGEGGQCLGEAVVAP